MRKQIQVGKHFLETPSSNSINAKRCVEFITLISTLKYINTVYDKWTLKIRNGHESESRTIFLRFVIRIKLMIRIRLQTRSHYKWQVCFKVKCQFFFSIDLKWFAVMICDYNHFSKVIRINFRDSSPLLLFIQKYFQNRRQKYNKSVTLFPKFVKKKKSQWI